MSNSDPILAALAAISNNRELIRDTYISGQYDKDGSKTDAQAAVLHANRVFVPSGRDAYRLSSGFVQYLDAVTQKQKLFELLGDEAGGQVSRLFNLSNEYSAAVNNGSIEAMDNVSVQFDEACALLADTFSTGIARLSSMAESNFAVVSTIEEKMRQNQHYLRQTSLFTHALEALDRYGFNIELERSHHEPLALSYRALVSRRKAEWHADISRLLHFFDGYLYRLRDIEPTVKRFRAFATFLQQNPGYQPPDFSEQHHRPQWLLRAPGFKVDAAPDISSVADVDRLRAAAANIPLYVPQKPKQREAGTTVRSVNQPEEVLQVPAYTLALEQLAEAAVKSPAPISAIAWRFEFAQDLKLPDDIWLIAVSAMVSIKRFPYENISLWFIEKRGESPLSRNLYVKDVMVHGR